MPGTLSVSSRTLAVSSRTLTVSSRTLSDSAGTLNVTCDSRDWPAKKVGPYFTDARLSISPFSRRSATAMPVMTRPNTVYLPSRSGRFASVM